MRSASRLSSLPRSEADIRRHGDLLSKAARAAFTARFTSVTSASATSQMASPVAGLIVEKRLPETLSTHCPLMSNFVVGRATRFSVGEDITVAMNLILSPDFG